MFFQNGPVKEVFNPLGIHRHAVIEFKVGALRDAGMLRFKKIIDLEMDGRHFARYLLVSRLTGGEYILEAFPDGPDRVETYVFSLKDTVPFSVDFLEGVAGQLYLTTPEGNEYQRATCPEDESRIDGVSSRVRVFSLDTMEVERTWTIQWWDYRRELESGLTESLNLELDETNGMFRIFVGEEVQDIFYTITNDVKPE